MTEQLNDETKERLMKTAQHITPLLPEELLGKALFWLFFIVLVLTPNNSWTQVSSGARELANVTGASERNARRLIQQNSPASNQRVSVLGLSETEHTVQSAQPLTLDFQDIEVRRVLQLLADLRDINLVVSESVTGNLSLRLKNISWDDALETILRVKNLAQRRYNNVMIVAPKSEVVAQEKSDLANARGVETLAPLETQLFRVRYGDAKGMLALINLGKNSILSKRGHGVVDERTNSLIVVDIAPRLEAISEVIEKLDIPLQQVAIEARIVIANKTFSEQLGISWGAYKQASEPASNANTAQLPIIPSNIAVAAGLSLPVVQAGSTTFSLGLSRANYAIDVELSALAAEGHAEVLARPRIVTTDKSPALIESGVEIPFQEASSSGATSTSFKDAVLSLRVVPQITPDQRIIMQLNVKQDTVGQIYDGIPSINTNAIQTQVLVNNGQTLVLGGIFQEDRNNAQTKTPLLAKIPILGRLFRRTVRREDKQELLIFITPNILDAATASTGAPSAGAFAPLMGASAQSGANLLP
ncbi:MAG: type IV pilus assembly protein PilQ [Candidatus Azotimanducaceae bacterium]|jgi:type IV pilus assembly protein PilQ|tara:strand:- start:2848 stop:4440 length:1593 start_codon:yes stop_codon:yes gene_type:complete